MEQPRIFLSRHLDHDSPFRSLAESGEIGMVAQSLLLFSPVHFRTIPKGDWLFFYSKSGVKYFLDQLSTLVQIASYQIACYGPSTARLWSKMADRDPDFIGDGKPAHVPTDFVRHIQAADTVVFVRAANSRMTVQRAIEDQIVCQDMIAYRNEQRQDVDIHGHFDCALLTSPLNADAFLQQAVGFKGDIITLGSTTADFVRQKFDIECIVSEDVAEMGMFRSFQTWMKDRSGEV